MARVRLLQAGAMNAHNTFEHPHAVQPQPFTCARLSGGELTLTAPKMSVVALEIA